MLSQIVRELLLPPGCLIVALALSLASRRRAPRASLVLAIGAVLGLYLLSIAPVALILSRWMEKEPALHLDRITAFKPQAIVILGGGAQVQAPEYEFHSVPSESSQKRIAYGAYLARKTELPILVSGGFGRVPEESEAFAMKFALDDYGLNPRWLEARGRTTQENATFSAPTLQKDGVQRIILVTSASHARRAKVVFEKNGFAVLAAPTGFQQLGPWDRGLMAVVPASRHFGSSADALRAALAEAWYLIKGD